MNLSFLVDFFLKTEISRKLTKNFLESKKINQKDNFGVPPQASGSLPSLRSRQNHMKADQNTQHKLYLDICNTECNHPMIKVIKSEEI